MKKIFIAINILLFSLILFVGWRSFRAWSVDSSILVGFKKTSPAGDKTITADKKKDATQGGVLSGVKFELEGEKVLPSKESFSGLIEKNLFHAQRREGAEEIKIETTSPSLQKPIIIEGIVIFKNYRAAVIKDTSSQAKGGRPTRRVRVGDAIENQKVIAIMKDRIIVKDENGEKVVKLHKSDKPQRTQAIEMPAAAPAPPPSS
jgi:hypothetical protein